MPNGLSALETSKTHAFRWWDGDDNLCLFVFCGAKGYTLYGSYELAQSACDATRAQIAFKNQLSIFARIQILRFVLPTSTTIWQLATSIQGFLCLH